MGVLEVVEVVEVLEDESSRSSVYGSFIDQNHFNC